MKKLRLIALGLVCLLLLCGCGIKIEIIQPTAAQTAAKSGSGELRAVVIDVGNADSSLICGPEGEVILIDAGETDGFGVISEQLEALGIERIDALVLTHPHSDHIGSAERVIRGYDVGRVYMTGVVHTSKLYEKLIDAISETKTPATRVSSGKSAKVGSLELEFWGPVREYSDLNNSSIVTRISYGGRTLMFMGDCETAAETDLVEKYGAKLKCDFLKVGHHGSKTSSSKKFLKCALPEYAAVPCGKGNDYGHPSASTLKRLKSLGATVYRSDKNGDITVTVTKKGELTVTTEK